MTNTMTEYHIKHAVYHFKKLAAAGDGFGGSVMGVALAFTVASLAGTTIAPEPPDSITTPETGGAVAEIKNGFATLEPSYRQLRLMEEKKLSGEEFQGYRAAYEEFKGKSAPVLQTVLLNPHLSEKQAETLMQMFQENFTDPATLNRSFRIADYGLLREKRTAVLKNPSIDTPEKAVAMISAEIADRTEGKALLFCLLTAIGAAGCGLIGAHISSGVGYRLRKPQKPHFSGH